MKKKILIVGNSAKEYSLTKWLSKDNEIFITSANKNFGDFATCVDIRENATSELLEFVMENGIDLTMVTSHIALQTNIATLFTNNNQDIFAPSLAVCKLIYDKALTKKVLYKLRIPTPKFGIFEKQAMALDYIKNLHQPFVIKTNDASSAVVLTSQNVAKNVLECHFAEKSQKVIIEDYVFGTPFAFYVITDGYKALPFGSSLIYKHLLDGDGGQLTTGMGACSPNYKISIEQENNIMDTCIYPILEYFEREGNVYSGILCLQGIISEDGNIQIIGLQPFMSDCDCQTVLNNIEENFNLYDLFKSCTLATFSDEYDYIPQKNKASASLVLCCTHKNSKDNIIAGLDDLDENTNISFFPIVKQNKYLEYEADYGPNIVITTEAGTHNNALEKLYSEAENVSYKGIRYRKDIGKNPTNDLC